VSWFTNPIGLTAFAALPLVLALHLYRRRYQQISVSALFLWIDPEAQESSGRSRQPLRRTPSFWLEMLAALLAALFLSGFDPMAKSETVHLVAVLDDSASISAQDGAPRKKIIQRLEQAFAEYGRDTRVTLIRSGVRASLLCGPAALIAEAKTALADWHPSAPSHDPSAALNLARELVPASEIWYFTDRVPGPDSHLGEQVRSFAFGTSLVNLSLAEARRSPANHEGSEPGSDVVTCVVRLHGPTAVSAKLQFLAGDQLLSERAIEVQPGQDVRLRLPLPTGTPAIRIQLSDDALELDNHATLYPAPRRVVHLGYQIDDAALGAMRLSSLPTILPDLERVSEISRADLVIAHDPAAAPAWSVVLPRDPETAKQREAYVAGFLPEKRHPLLRGMTLEGVLWSRATNFALPGIPILSVGDLPLISESAPSGSVQFYLNLLPQRSTLGQSPDWPIFLSNLIEMCRAALPGPREVNLVAGQAFEFIHPGAALLTLHSADGQQDFQIEDLLRIDDLPAYPNYRLQLQNQTLARFAVNFVDPGESDLSAASTGETAPQSGRLDLARQRYAASPVSRLLLLLLLMAVLGDWWVLGRERKS
jgi:Aerotolerance regulator N-terminal